MKEITGGIPRREYGSSGRMLSVVGLGGLVVSGMEQPAANRLVAEAIERGVNYFDVAPSYGDAEAKLGPALQPYRQNAFLACKTLQRSAEATAAELRQSLRRLRTDYLDLYQHHCLENVAQDVDAIFAKGGAMGVFLAARKDGRVRHLGFSAHTVEAAKAAMDRYDFDSILFPVNYASWLGNGFGPEVLEVARKRGLARLALKAMARQKWPAKDPERSVYRKCWYQPITERREAGLALRFTLNQPVTAAVSPGEEAIFRLMLDVADDLRPLMAAELEELKTRAQCLGPLFPQ